MCPNNPEVFALTLAEFGEKHRLSRSLIYQMIKRGDLHVTHYSAQSPRVTHDDEQQFLDRIAAQSEVRRQRNAEGRTLPAGRPSRTLPPTAAGA